MTFFLDGDGNGMSIDGLNQQLAQLSRQIEHYQSRIDLIRDQSKKLALGQQSRAPSQPVVVTKIRVELDLWHAYAKALSALRKSVDETSQRYGKLADNAQVRAEITSKNAGLPQPKFSLGPSQQFRDIERTLKAHENFVKSRNEPRHREAGDRS